MESRATEAYITITTVKQVLTDYNECKHKKKHLNIASNIKENLS